MKKLICIGMILSLVGCSTFKPVEHREVALPDILLVGKTYKITTTSGDVIQMKVVEVTADEVVGTREDGLGRTVSALDISSIEVETIDGGKTTLAVIGGIVLLPIAIVAVVLGCMMGACS